MSATRTRESERSWLVILADDNDDHAYLIEMALERAAPMPVEVKRARNGEEAARMVEETPPDLLLLDLNMPGQSGHEVLNRIKGDDRLRSVPVAVLTSSDRDEDIAESYGLGGNHFITKPGDPAQLQERLGSLLKNLQELQGIQRGVRGISRTAESALSPWGYSIRQSLPWVAFFALFLILLLYAYLAGVLS